MPVTRAREYGSRFSVRRAGHARSSGPDLCSARGADGWWLNDRGGSQRRWRTRQPQTCRFPATLAGVTVTGLSLLFFGILVQVAGTAPAAQYIVTISLAVVQIAFVPQSWIYVYGAANRLERRARFRHSAVIEMTGAAAGLTLALLLGYATGLGNAVPLAYVALCVAGSTSAEGVRRGGWQWVGDATVVALPSATRLPRLRSRSWPERMVVLCRGLVVVFPESFQRACGT